MPISQDQARQVRDRLVQGRPTAEMVALLDATHADERPVPPRVPCLREWSADAHRKRVAFIQELGTEIPHLAGDAPHPDAGTLRGSIENFIGFAQVPVGLIGPLRVNGLHARGDFYVPLATSEGALVASHDRGAHLVTAAGGAICLTTSEHVQRAPAFVFESVTRAAYFAAWAVDQFEALQAIVAQTSNHGRLLELQTHIEGNQVYLIFAFHTGDAAGQNMVTFCTAAVCDDILARTPVQPRYWFLESNMSGDKKATALSFLQTRGRNVTAEARIPRALVEGILHTTPERMADYWRVSFVGGVRTGSIGVNGHIANGIAALFLACGQDVACVSEASVGVTRLEVTDEGDLYAAVSLPNLIVGSVGGGTRLPTAQECLRIMDCLGDGRASKLAEICAAVTLAGELSIVGALCAGDFARAHAALGRGAR
ncbi:hydroxymethylglutaryl-CoA reductase [Longimicrobium sp.]|uniref:hydroxymethylglutaryl-CoA reductase n=1 Tax=Longimicrobium sp. TaxID=2029185 RepID=UPI002E3108B0|nr:hydroxymethylglutaryl-CoA reductase [Longimicrobium sp.]HEX6042626.1 hydroxymethylglutaryl-CoA reductase [Longimicrobium sp.]